MSFLNRVYGLIQPLLFRMEPERAHQLITTLLDTSSRIPGLINLVLPITTPSMLATNIAGLSVPNPIGLAAGFDKDGRHIRGMARLGFGFLELGTVTPMPQVGNPKPRLFRLTEDRALINRMGFNNAGSAALAQRLQHSPRPVPLGINIGKNKHTPNDDAASDYVKGIQALSAYADYIVVNISSPNTPGLRDLSRREPLEALLLAVQAARIEVERDQHRPMPPLFVKLSPDEDNAGLDAALGAALAVGVDGLIATNTTVTRTNLRSSHQTETGGLSGQPLRQRSLDVLRYLADATNGKLPLIGVGGIASGHDAYQRICAGASLVQLYSALIYNGPDIIQRICIDLAACLRHDGHTTIASAVGSKRSSQTC